MQVSMISAALVGYGSTIALALAAATAVSATPEQTASWVLSVCFTKALGSALLSWWHRIPVVLAWSTPGAALIAATVTLAVTASGIAVFGIAAAFWGLVAGLMVWATERAAARFKAR
jgi:benzoate membrane transport protein